MKKPKKIVKKKVIKKTTKKVSIKLNIDKIVDYIIEGKTFREISKLTGIKLSTLHDNISKDEHFARVQSALAISADTYAEKGEEVLKKAKGNSVEIARARELSQYYRWKSAKRNPKKYSDKIDVTTDNKELPSSNIIFIPSNNHESTD